MPAICSWRRREPGDPRGDARGQRVLVATGLTEAETVSTVPLNLGSGNPLEGFYVANYPQNIQKAPATNSWAFRAM